ncbi:transposase [Acidiferrobacter sp. SPIII_3]|uniref:RNA-guided endonuclease TnpB family protein n=1 Tax=Acidiferrobacter sp. SPIII_3 TaxID=1281578 RepID=UPI000D735253|nr:RNA-guided endonuclease TnpB family protein [Acidiferrobacter sp. SPIII_3]AWP22364.1 transposase [Acidiferrobacter sp. SPIII_3]
MPYRKVMYRLYPNATQTERLETMRGLHQRLYNTALEERIRVYQETGKGLSFADQCKVLTQWRRISAGLASLNARKGLSFADQCKVLTQWRRISAGLASLNAQSEQVTLKRLHLAFQAFFRRVKNGDTPGFPRFKSLRRYPGWGYKTHGDGWRLHAGENSVHGKLYLQGVGHIPMRGRARTTGTPVTCEILHKAGKWYASVTLEIETIQRERGTAIGAFDWGLTDFLTLATPMGIETVANPRRLKNQLAELKRLGQEVSRKIRMAQERTGRKKGFPVSVSLRHAISHLARLHAKVARQRQDFLHQTSAGLVKRFGAIGTESLTVQNMVRSGGVRKKGLNREIYAASPAAFLNMTRTKAEEAGSWYEEAPTREIKPTQRCHGPCGPQCGPCGPQCGCGQLRRRRRGRSNPRNAVMGHAAHNVGHAAHNVDAGSCRTRRKRSRTGSTSVRTAVPPVAEMKTRLWCCCVG